MGMTCWLLVAFVIQRFKERGIPGCNDCESDSESVRAKISLELLSFFLFPQLFDFVESGVKSIIVSALFL